MKTTNVAGRPLAKTRRDGEVLGELRDVAASGRREDTCQAVGSPSDNSIAEGRPVPGGTRHYTKEPIL